MRKAERILKDKHRRLPEQYKKVDTSVNGDAERLAEMHKEVERRLHPLRIDRSTVIYVPSEKCNEGYRRKWMKKAGMEKYNVVV